MRKAVLIANGLVLAGVSWLFAQGTQRDLASVLPAAQAPSAELAALAPSPNIKALENRAALSPSASAVTELANAYLDRSQPGLATAVIERAPSDVRGRPEVGQVYARALFSRGKVREALAVSRDVGADCEGAEGLACPPWLLAKAARQVAFFEQLVDAGIEDPVSDPAATMAAYDRSSREVQLVAMR